MEVLRNHATAARGSFWRVSRHMSREETIEHHT